MKELRTAAEDTRPLQVSGALAAQLEKELARGAAPGAVRAAGRIEDAAILVRVLGGAPTEEDERELRAAKRAKVPVVAVQTGAEVFDIPYVLATDVVMCRPGAGFPVEEIAAAVAARLGEGGTSLAARLPVLREPVSEALIARFSRQNGIIGVAVFLPGADFAVLTLNQIRLVLRLAAAHGVELDQTRVPEVLATIGAGFGFRAVARQVLGVVPIAGWVVKGGIAYVGTRALGEAAHRYFHTVAESVAEAEARAVEPMLSGPGPKVRETTWREAGWQVPSTPRSCFRSRKPTPGSSTSRRRARRARAATPRSSRGPGRASRNGFAASARAAHGCAQPPRSTQPPQCRSDPAASL